MDLALFDFDGTITTKGAYPDFVRYAVRGRRRLFGTVILSPLIVGYHLGLVSERAIRIAISRVAFQGDDPDRLRTLGERYAQDILPGMTRPLALDRITWHRARGDRVVVVSASLDSYLEPWCRTAGVEVICTELEAIDGRLTGRYRCGDCCGQEKARRIRERYALADYVTVWAYGDTEEDRQMLELANRRYFRWEEIADPREASTPAQSA